MNVYTKLERLKTRKAFSDKQKKPSLFNYQRITADTLVICEELADENLRLHKEVEDLTDKVRILECSHGS